jgi:hypothetical protein
MKAAQLVGRKLFEFVEVDMPTVKDGECLIKLERVSICGSDIRHGYGPRYPEEDYPLAVGRPCHECAGVVVHSATFRLPSDVPYSYEGSCLSYAWRISARAVRRLRRDARLDEPLWVEP